MSAQMLIRIDPEIKEKLATLARYEKKSTSRLLREIIEDYVKERDIAAYIDELWVRIRRKLESKGVKEDDVAAVTREVRQAKG